jgi:hypothetical protein
MTMSEPGPQAPAVAASRVLPEWDTSVMTEAMSYCWASPAGWDDDTPGKPYCNLRAGHKGNHICHVVWAPDTDLADKLPWPVEKQ